jgi:hypothetical protein
MFCQVTSLILEVKLGLFHHLFCMSECVSHTLHFEAVDGLYETWYEIRGNVEHPYVCISIRAIHTAIIFVVQNSEVQGT